MTHYISTENNIQYLVITYNEKKSEKYIHTDICTHTYIYVHG